MNNATLYADFLQMAVDATLKAAEKVPEANRFRVAAPGKAHPLWLVGHLANTNNLLILRWCCEKDSVLPKGYGKQFSPDFAGGDPIVTDPATYPSWEEIVDNYRKVGEACVAAIRELDEQTLAGDLRGGAPDQMKQYFGNVEKTLRSMIAHDSHHRGQLAMLGALPA